jgi:hypothetical protein
MNFTKNLWKLISEKDRVDLLSRLNAVDRTYFQDLFANKKLAQCFINSESIFIHVPKCAGTSISNALYPGTTIGHRPAIWFQTRFPEEYNNYFTYSFTRNPWDRLVSAYTYLRSQENTRQDGEWAKMLNRYDSFEKFVLDWVCAENISKKIHFCSQHLYICDNFGSVSLDYVGKLESLNDDFAHVAEQLGVKGELKNINRSRSDDYRSYYNDKTIGHVASVYQRDIQLFGYSFEGL